MLDDLGLDATLEWYCAEFTSLHGIDCSYSSRYDESLLSKEISLDFFRICQEVLSYVQQHGSSKRIKISVTESSGKVKLIIEGINANEMITHGVMSINERVASFGGKYDAGEDKLTVTT